MQIQGHAALVTGGGSGLGEATARELARLGAKVAVLDLNLANAERVAADIGSLVDQVLAAVRAGDQILCMSNGGFGGIHQKLLARLQADPPLLQPEPAPAV